jgi:aminoglycoside 6'-N-acetyltransferase
VTIVLRPLREDDEAELRRIHETPEVACWWGTPEPGFPWSDDPDSTRMAIELDGAVAGMIEFWEEPTPRYRHATIDLFLDPAVRGRGIGGEAVAQLARKLFAERGHHRVTIDPAVENVAAIRAYEKVGFTRVGVMRRYERAPGGGGWRDGLLMELLADDARA